MSYSKHKGENNMTNDMYMLYKRAHRETPWNPWGSMPARGQGGHGDEDESLYPNMFEYSLVFHNPEIRMATNIRYAYFTETGSNLPIVME